MFEGIPPVQSNEFLICLCPSFCFVFRHEARGLRTKSSGYEGFAGLSCNTCAPGFLQHLGTKPRTENTRERRQHGAHRRSRRNLDVRGNGKRPTFLCAIRNLLQMIFAGLFPHLYTFHTCSIHFSGLHGRRFPSFGDDHA